MNTTKLVRIASVMILLGIISTSSFSQVELVPTESALPPVQNQGEVVFMTGGIGQDESHAIFKEGKKWPLMLELAKAGTAQAVYISNVQIVIRDASGSTVLETMSKGPYLLAKLPPGKYSLDATYEGDTLHRDLYVQEKEHHKKITLLWPAPKSQ
ncbi:MULTISPECIES: carboxypeptidase-like regulatory domain-containing protein [Nitrosomonas]|uniref:Carboxypeptidase regulatory-like domain-containing protein n=2 Tax=Nitrosomonas communis TaxID=44574 RepID=A0A5D3Y6P5_9PROT|nr:MULTISPECIES: carboxypeptidase-like regulatory domain-containing protein [Nitrosomonas]TYP71589.1 hypothetical protein BCL69_11104 [Nitrosomonas communis]UVS60885.1 carboxypeptidase-like regulatory domain-containing protein [Nitrosomonas sp. PLL12]